VATATSELDNAEFDAAKRDFRKILALGSGGVRERMHNGISTMW